LPALKDPQLIIEFAHRFFNLVVGVFILGTAVIAWTKYREARYVLIFSSASFIGLLAQIILGMVTVQTRLDALVSDAHLGLASAVFGLVIVNAVMVWILKNGLKTQTVVIPDSARYS
jgi:heme A synthase